MEFYHAETWERQELEQLRGWERPRVRVRFGTGDDSFTELQGWISPEGRNVYVEIKPYGAGGASVCSLISWGLLLEVLNDPHSSPLWIWDRCADSGDRRPGQ